jgi:uncharacterized protein YjbI with pentapeptide repeats
MEYTDEWKRGQLLSGQPVHFPAGLPDDQRRIEPDWIAQAIKLNVPVDVDRALIAGPLVLASARVSNPFKVRNSRCSEIDFSYCTFDQVVALAGTVVGGSANLHAARFNCDLLLDSVECMGVLDLSDACIEVGLEVVGATLHKLVRADGLVVRRSIDSTRTTFEGEVQFVGAHVGGMLSFNKSIFKKRVVLEGLRVTRDLFCKVSTFEDEVRFLDVQVGETADFTGSTFKKAAFSRMRVGASLFCGSTTFEGDASFASVQVGGEADFDKATLKQRAYFDGMRIAGATASFRESTFNRATFARMAVAGTLFCTSATFEGDASLRGAQIEGEAYFSQTTFRQKAEFFSLRVAATLFCVRTTFGEASFRDAKVEGDATFVDSTFKGKASFEGMRVTGALFFKPTTFEDAARFLDVHVGQTADFSGSAFKEANFTRMRVAASMFCGPTTFEGAAVFSGAHFGGEANFSDATFKQEAGFDGMRIGRDVFFRPATFEKEATFLDMQVGETADFTGTKFRQATFDRMHVAATLFCNPATFAGPASFAGLQVTGEAILSGATFQQAAVFDGMRTGRDLRCVDTAFEQDSSFQGVEVGGSAYFSSAVFKKATFDRMHAAAGLFCNQTTFKSEASFRAVKIEGEADFTQSTFEGPWVLTEASLKTLRVDDGLGDRPSRGTKPEATHSDSSVDLRGCTYERIQVYWRPFLERMVTMDRQPYTQFERAMRRVGRDDLADAAYFHRRQLEGNRIRLSRNPFRWAWDRIILRGIAGYGVRQGRTLLIVLAFPIVAWLAFYFTPGAAHQAVDPARPTVGCQARLDWQDAAWLSVQTYLPFTVPSPSRWKPTDCRIQVPRTSLMLPVTSASLANFISIAGWVFIPIAAASLSGLLRYVGSRE